MSIELLGIRLRSAVSKLARLTARRAQAEAKLEADFHARRTTVETEFAEREREVQENFAAAQSAAIRNFQDNTRAIETQFTRQTDDTTHEFSDARERVERKSTDSRQRLEAEHKETRWTIETILEADRKVARDEQVTLQRSVGMASQKVKETWQEIVRLVGRWKLGHVLQATEGAQAGVPATDEADEQQELQEMEAALKQHVSVAEKSLEQLQRSRAPHFLKGFRLFLIFGLLWLLAQAPAVAGLMHDLWYVWVGATLVGTVCIGIVVRLLLLYNLRHRVYYFGSTARRAAAAAEVLQKRCLEEANARFQQELQQARKNHDDALQQAATTFKHSLDEFKQQQARAQEQIRAKYEPQLAKLQKKHDRSLQKNEARYQKAMARSTERFDEDLEAINQKRSRDLDANRSTYEKGWEFLIQQWRLALDKFTTVATQVREECDRLFPPWDALLESTSPLPTEVPLGLCFGQLDVALEHFPDGVPQDERLRNLSRASMQLPALLNFPHQGSLLLKAEGDGRAQAVELLQAVMLRCLTALPPGKARFTIIDPVGLGENFAAFAHLADFDEKLVTSRIWTETGHIEKRLSDLTEHIENVIQKYLRNQFETLEDYNSQAGEVAEPYRFLVVAHFPVHFTDAAVKRLVSIAQSGLRCGIHTFILVDEREELPDHFDLADLERNSTVLTWNGKRLVWQDPEFGRFPLQLEAPPSAEATTTLLQRAGENAKFASRVEVPFTQIAPAPELWWKGDTRDGIRVALGKAGATRKQLMELGEGTAQHVLIAGKTGSGKSTLLHALIIQLALSYSPDEVELYLVDFKKGVEFKTYAAHELPHARVVAIESEREFGLSVLQRLDVELRKRGELFRAQHAHDIATYRTASGRPLPRVLLVVDEFQEFFVEDDRVAQEAALLLDRLVRQGRAFGIHILLGSQTLGGAYSLARSTIDQMAVRIALQCSEADGHLILSKDNSAARLLSRPGEAIYNDANGLVEGNNLFQVVWVSEHQRDVYLDRVQGLAQQQSLQPRSIIIFEGNAPALLTKNQLLHRLLEGPNGSPVAERVNGVVSRSATTTGSYTAWLGDSIAIKDPTAAVFRRQSGSNLILIGQHGEAALSILSAALVSIGAGLGPREENDPKASPRFYLLCDASEDTAADKVFHELADTLPQPTVMAGWREMAGVLSEVAAEVDRRLKERDASGPPMFVLIYGLQQFRDLRRPEDEFSFSSKRGEEKAPARLFASIVRDGPPLGVFTLAWCDTLNNVQRFLDRPLLREFEMRVLFQMNANDSSNLIDSPVASRLGLHRALFYTEDQGKLEKFRPYGLPPADWLAWVKNQLARQPATTEH
jgi:hypothetical protein